MKTLYIIRHAKSSWDNPLQPDFERPLNDRGKRDAPRMGKRLKEKRLVPELMLSSPATRALSTCQHIAKVLGYHDDKIKTEKRLYHADEETWLSVVQQLNDHLSTVVLFGHNPGLTDFVNELTNSTIDNVPTCGVVACTFHVDSWKGVDWGKGKLEFFDFPKKED